MACGCFHYPPTSNLFQRFGAKRLEPAHFRFNVIRLDIEMNAARMIDLLYLDVQANRVGLKFCVCSVLRILLCAAWQT
jgi:hypothetical protein